MECNKFYNRVNIKPIFIKNNKLDVVSTTTTDLLPPKSGLMYGEHTLLTPIEFNIIIDILRTHLGNHIICKSGITNYTIEIVSLLSNEDIKKIQCICEDISQGSSINQLFLQCRIVYYIYDDLPCNCI